VRERNASMLVGNYYKILQRASHPTKLYYKISYKKDKRGREGVWPYVGE
jgi:hypothetical protein